MTEKLLVELALVTVGAVSCLVALWYSNEYGDRADAIFKVAVTVAGLCAAAAFYISTGAIRLWRP